MDSTSQIDNSIQTNMKVAVLASGRGSNFEAIAGAVRDGSCRVDIVLVISDKKEAPVLDKARNFGVEALCVEPRNFPGKRDYELYIAEKLEERGVELLILAGYMRLVGEVLLERYPMKIVNIHPSLLPSFKGLEAQRQALDYGVKYSGCTVHFVDAGVDSGPIILQTAVPVKDDDTVETLSQRILEQEHLLYPRAIQMLATGRVCAEGRRVRII